MVISLESEKRFISSQILGIFDGNEIWDQIFGGSRTGHTCAVHLVDSHPPTRLPKGAVLVVQVNGGFRFYMVYGDHQSLSYFSLVLQVMHDVSFLLRGVFTLAVVPLQEGLIPASRYFLL